jgi:aspartate kinase
MSGKTNELVGWCKEAAPLYDQAEYDTVVASGEQVTSGLLAIVLKDMGLPARSWQGWQMPIYRRRPWLGAHRRHRRRETSSRASRRGARSLSCRRLPGRAQGERAHRHARARRLGHLGGGASRPASGRRAATSTPTSTGSTPPIRASSPRRAARQGLLRGDAGDGLARGQGASGALGRDRHGTQASAPIVRSSFDPTPGTQDRRHPPGTLICDEEEIVEEQNRHRHRLRPGRGQVSCAACPTSPASPPPSSAAGRSEHQCRHDRPEHLGRGATTDITFTVPTADFDGPRPPGDDARPDRLPDRIEGATDVVKVSIIGVGMRSHAGVAARAFRALAERASTSAPSPPPRSRSRC